MAGPGHRHRQVRRRHRGHRAAALKAAFAHLGRRYANAATSLGESASRVAPEAVTAGQGEPEVAGTADLPPTS